MRLFYLISTIVVFLLILVIALPQVGATCVWYLINPNTPAFLVLLQVAGLGAVMGGLLIMFWKTPKKNKDEEDIETSEIKGE